MTNEDDVKARKILDPKREQEVDPGRAMERIADAQPGQEVDKDPVRAKVYAKVYEWSEPVRRVWARVLRRRR